MSNYRFIASDKELAEYDNGIVILGGRKARSEEKQDMRILKEDDMSYASIYTKKKQCAFIEWYYTKDNAQVMLEYIRNHLKTSKEIELWDVWLNENRKPNIMKCSIKELNIQKIKEIFGKAEFVEPECLVVYK